MKIILSRKGFDSSYGKTPSPIFPSGALRSLPIPEAVPTSSAVCYAQIRVDNLPLSNLVNDLTGGKIVPSAPAHLDPDLDSHSRPRLPGWKQLFGQAGAAEGHLRNCGVQAGDLFLFYGWFKQVEQVQGKFQYVRHAPDLHVIFGWLQIEQRIEVTNRTAIPAWALAHPHCGRTPHRLDALYVATDQLQLPGLMMPRPGGGIFSAYSPLRCLTAPDAAQRSIWQLPAWFHPATRHSCLSYHHTPNRWTKRANHVLLQTVGRGQEFILDCVDYPEALPWLSHMLNNG